MHHETISYYYEMIYIKSEVAWFAKLRLQNYYLLNLLVVSLAWPQLRGNEVSVLFTHICIRLGCRGSVPQVAQEKSGANRPRPVKAKKKPG